MHAVVGLYVVEMRDPLTPTISVRFELVHFPWTGMVGLSFLRGFHYYYSLSWESRYVRISMYGRMYVQGGRDVDSFDALVFSVLLSKTEAHPTPHTHTHGGGEGGWYMTHTALLLVPSVCG